MRRISVIESPQQVVVDSRLLKALIDRAMNDKSEDYTCVEPYIDPKDPNNPEAQIEYFEQLYPVEILCHIFGIDCGTGLPYSDKPPKLKPIPAAYFESCVRDEIELLDELEEEETAALRAPLTP